MSGQGDGEGSCRACRQQRVSVLYSHGTAPSEASRSWPAVMEISWVGLCARRVLYRTPDRQHAFAACCCTWASHRNQPGYRQVPARQGQRSNFVLKASEWLCELCSNLFSDTHEADAWQERLRAFQAGISRWYVAICPNMPTLLV